MSSKKLLALIALFSLSFGFLIFPKFTRGQTIEELQARIAELTQLIQQLQQQLAQLQSSTQPPSNISSQWCYNFNVDLYFGKSGRDVNALQIALEKEGFFISSSEKERAYFGDTTLAAVIKFQEKYAKEILTPLGLVAGTGYVGSLTRAKLNQLYGCVVPPPPIPTPTPIPIPPPILTPTPIPTPTSTPTPTPRITVISPNGGEKWEIGKTYEIKWTQVGLEGEKVDIFLTQWTSGFVPLTPMPLPPGSTLIASGLPAESQSYFWTIPQSITPGTNYAIYIQQSTGTKKAFDFSDKPFTITYLPGPEDPVSGTLSVDKTTAKVGENITLTITAKDLQGVQGVSAFYQGKWDFKSCDFATTCTKTFTFAETKPGTYAYGGYVYGRRTNGQIESSPTTPSFVTVKVITEPTPTPTPIPIPIITSISPNSGTANDMITIYGKNLIGTRPSGIYIEFLKNGIYKGAISSPIYEQPDGLALRFILSGNFVGNVEPGTYQIRVVNDYGKSNTVDFTILPIPSITVISPNGGEKWEIGKTYTIKWSMSNLPKSWMVDVYLTWNGGTKFIGGSLLETGIMNWNIPLDTQARDDYKIRVDLVQLPRTGQVLASDESDAPFSIVQPTASIKVRYPNGGETFYQGSSMYIAWETTPSGFPENITLELLEGETKVWNIGTVKNTGYYYWQIPSTLQGNLFKIRAKISDTVYDDSDGTFSITPRTFSVNVWKDPTEGGTVTSLPEGINCGSVCSYRFPAGTKLVLKATPAQGYSFVKWIGCEFVDQDQNCNITVNYDKGVMAIFQRVPILTIDLAPDTPTSSTIYPGKNIQFLKVTLSASGGDITLSQISVGSDSENASQNFANISVYDGQTLLGTAVSSPFFPSPSEIYWVVNITPVKIANGATKTLTITSDVLPSAIGKRLRLGIIALGFADQTPINLVGPFPVWGNLMSVSAPLYKLSVFAQPSEGGKIYDSAIQCPPSCSAQYPEGSEVTLTATPNYGYTFVSWSGCDYVYQSKCIVKMTSDKTVTANFAKIQKYTLWVYKNTIEGGTVTSQPYGIICDTLCRLTSYDFAQGTVVTLFATPAPGYVFRGWSGDCSGNNPTCTLTIDREKKVYALFDRASYSLTVTKNPTTGGTITSSPSGINCGSTCSYNFTSGTKVTLTATPAPGYGVISLSSWSGCDSVPTMNQCVVTMNSNRTVNVIFTPVITPTPTPTPIPLPDLIVSDIYYQSPYIYVKYCNVGSGWSSSDFLIKLRNNQTGQEYGGNVAYRFAVPQPGECKITGGYTPSLIGLNPGQSASITATIDWEQRVKESNENNNTLTKTISLLSLKDLSDWLAALEAAVKELQKLLGL